MNKSFRKLLILVSLIVLPIIFLWAFKEIIFNGGDENRLPTLAIVSDTPIPDFSFINQDCDTITNQDYEGKIYIANFMFTSCPTICKKMSRNISIKLRPLLRYDNVYFLSHTIDPTNDSPDILKKYANRLKHEAGADLSRWNFVTGDKEEIYRIAESYLTYASDEEVDNNHKGFQLAHSSNFILIDTKGRIRSGFDSNNNVFGAYDGLDSQSLKLLVRDVGMLVSETKRKARDCEK